MLAQIGQQYGSCGGCRKKISCRAKNIVQCHQNGRCLWRHKGCTNIRASEENNGQWICRLCIEKIEQRQNEQYDMDPSPSDRFPDSQREHGEDVAFLLDPTVPVKQIASIVEDQDGWSQILRIG